MNFYSHRTVEEQKNRLPEAFQENYERTTLDRIEIDGEEIVGYFEYSFLEEKSYKTQPVRSNDGSIQDLESYQTFLTPRLIIKYNMMEIEDYRKLMKKLKSKNTFAVTCYDIVEDKRVTHQMYLATPSMPIIYQRYLQVMGIQEYSIELIGTNVKISYEIIYDFNLPPEVTGWNLEKYATQDTRPNDKNVVGNIQLSDGDMLYDYVHRVYGIKLLGWNTHPDGSGWQFNDNERYLISSDYTLYAQWGVY